MKIRHLPRAVCLPNHGTITGSPGFKKWKKLRNVNCTGSRGQWPFVKNIINDFLGQRGVLIEGTILSEEEDGVIYDDSNSSEEDEYEFAFGVGDIVLGLAEGVTIYEILEDYNSTLQNLNLKDIYVIEKG